MLHVFRTPAPDHCLVLTPDGDPTVSLLELAKELGVSTTAIRNAIRRSTLSDADKKPIYIMTSGGVAGAPIKRIRLLPLSVLGRLAGVLESVAGPVGLKLPALIDVLNHDYVEYTTGGGFSIKTVTEASTEAVAALSKPEAALAPVQAQAPDSPHSATDCFMTTAQVATALGVNPSTIRMRIHRYGKGENPVLVRGVHYAVISNDANGKLVGHPQTYWSMEGLVVLTNLMRGTPAKDFRGKVMVQGLREAEKNQQVATDLAEFAQGFIGAVREALGAGFAKMEQEVVQLRGEIAQARKALPPAVPLEAPAYVGSSLVIPQPLPAAPILVNVTASPIVAAPAPAPEAVKEPAADRRKPDYMEFLMTECVYREKALDFRRMIHDHLHYNQPTRNESSEFPEREWSNVCALAGVLEDPRLCNQVDTSVRAYYGLNSSNQNTMCGRIVDLLLVEWGLLWIPAGGGQPRGVADSYCGRRGLIKEVLVSLKNQDGTPKLHGDTSTPVQRFMRVFHPAVIHDRILPAWRKAYQDYRDCLLGSLKYAEAGNRYWYCGGNRRQSLESDAE